MNGPARNILSVFLAAGLCIAAAPGALAQAKAPPRRNDIAAQAVEMDSLLRAGKVNDVAKKLEPLWRDAKRTDPLLSGGAAAILADSIRALCRRDPKARDSYRMARDDAANRFEGEGATGSLADLAEWIVLNRALDQTDRTLAWWNRIRKQPHAKDVLARFRCWMEPMLEQNGQLGDVALLIDDPAGTVRAEHAGLMNTLRRDSSDLNRQVALKVFHDRNARHYAALLLAGRAVDARKLAIEAMRLDHSADLVITMVQEAVEHGKPMPEHVNWIELSAAADPRADDLKKKIADAVQKDPTPVPPASTPTPGARGNVTTAQVPLADPQVER